MAKTKRKKKNPIRHYRDSDIRNLQADAVSACYRLFMAVALTVALDKHEAGTGNVGAIHHIVEQLEKLKADYPTAADAINGILFCVEAIEVGPWIADYVKEMNDMIGELNADRITVDELAQVLDEEYDILLDYKEI